MGGTAEIFRARLAGSGVDRPVVVKRILPQHLRDSRFRSMFQQEARVLATLDHPNVVRLLDFAEVKGSLLLAMEYVDGGDLATLRASLRLPAPLAAYIALEVAAALEYVHGRADEADQAMHLVHRDVSPQNILLSTTGEVKLTDFGIARPSHQRDRSDTRVIRGKLAYLAPEQAWPGALIDARADLFALGAVLYELLFGRGPFEAPSDEETLARLRQAEVELEESWLELADRPLLAILRRCLAREPAARFPSAAALSVELRRYLHALDRPWGPAAVAQWVAEVRPARP